MSSTVCETTPSGRTGFLKLLLSRGFEVYVVDAMERGRSGWCALNGVWKGPIIQRSLKEAWTLFRFDEARNFKKRIAFTEQRFPIDVIEGLALTFVPRWVMNSTGYCRVHSSASKIGPSVIVCHSQGSESSFNAAHLCPELVRGIVALESQALPAAPIDASIPITTVLGTFSMPRQPAIRK